MARLALCSHFCSSLCANPHHPPLWKVFDQESFFIDFAMALSKATILHNVFKEADTPEELQHFLETTLDITSVGYFVEYVVRTNYQEEWRNLVSGFPSTR